MPWWWVIFPLSMKYFYIMIDSRCTFNRYKTKQTTMAGYKSLYVGCDIPLYYSYAFVICNCWTAFMYGVAIPILLPIAVFAIIN